MEGDVVIKVHLNGEEWLALCMLSQAKDRDPDKQAAVLVREGLLNYGLLHWVPTADQMTLKIFETGRGL